MPINNFNRYPYNDDFTEDNLYYRLLFQPGRPVQARELTQIQTLLQNQISKLGEHIFKEGTLVLNGQFAYDKTNTHHLKLETTDPTGKAVRVHDIKPGMHIKPTAEAGGSSVAAPDIGIVKNVIPSENGDPPTILFSWLSGGPEGGSSGFYSSQNLNICDPKTGIVKYYVTTVAGGNHYGPCTVFSVQPGIYFWQGMFVKSNGGGLVLSKYGILPTYRIGFLVNQSIITDDPNSYDPASETSNFSAPGADRYKIQLQLIKIGDGITMNTNLQPDYFDIAKIDRGHLLTTVKDQTIYNQLAKEFAARTFEESGNYISTPYIINGGMKNKGTPDTPVMMAELTQGVSYVGGYRHSLNDQNRLFISKGRDVIPENLNIDNAYGDNFLYMYDHANTTENNSDNANGFFTVGSGAGQYTANDWYGRRGEAVSIHCVPKKLVTDHSLTDQWKWESTLVGTARPMQMLRNQAKTGAAHSAGRTGEVYQLWLGDFKSSPISNTISVTNIIKDVSAYANATHTVFTFPPNPFDEPSIDQQNHGITANDRISVIGSDTVTEWNIHRHQVSNANTMALIVNSAASFLNGLAEPSAGSLTIHRTTANTSPYRAVVLDEGASAGWNGSYIGATISVANCVPRTIIDSTGTNADATEQYYNRESSVEGQLDGFADSGYNRFGWNKPATVILDRDLVDKKTGGRYVPKKDDSYTINLGMKQARSTVHNYNVSTTGAPQFPAQLSTQWNVDAISGIVGGNLAKLDDEVYGKRIDGYTMYNQNADNVDLADALLFKLGHSAVKQTSRFGDMDAGHTSNTTIYFTGYAVETCGGAALYETFSPALASAYSNFSTRPVIYPYQTGTETLDPTATSSKHYDETLSEIRNNFTLINRTTGETLTNKITKVVVRGSAVGSNPHQADVYMGSNFVAGNEYVLICPLKSENVKAAYKSLIAANVTHTIAMPSPNINGRTDYSRGQVEIEGTSYTSTEGSRINLGVPDGYKLRKVVDLNPDGSGTDASANTALADSDTDVDVTNRFTFDTGQRDMFYDNCSLVLKADKAPPTGNLIVCFDRFERMDKPKSDLTRVADNSSPSYFSVDSYQWTTDLTFGLVTPEDGVTFLPGELIKTATTEGYVVDFANTGGGSYAKVRLQDVRSSTGGFKVGDVVKFGTSKQGTVKTVTDADVTYSEHSHDAKLNQKGIPTYTDRAGRKYLLRNWLDFRPYVSSNNRTSDTISDAVMLPIPTLAGIRTGKWNSSYTGSAYTSPEHTLGGMRTEAVVDAYAGRIDKLIVTKEGSYTTIKGTPAKNPRPPMDLPAEQALTLFVLQIPAYTPDPQHVQIKPTQAMRHTMKDIGRLAKRIENLEYYVSLNALERAAADTTITDEDGNERFKNGIVTDDFTSYRIADISGKTNFQFTAGRGVLRPKQIKTDDPTHGILIPDETGTNKPMSAAHHFTEFVTDDGRASGVRHFKPSDERSITMLDFVRDIGAISQPYATMYESVNPFHAMNYTGDLNLSPDWERWFTTEFVPEYDTVLHGMNEALITISDSDDPQTKADAINAMDGLWEVFSSGSLSLGNIESTALESSVSADGTLEYTVSSDSISLGSLATYTGAISMITNAINQYGMQDGNIRGFRVLPYIRSRHVLLHASGLKPFAPAVTIFDDYLMEDRVSRAIEIYMVCNDTRSRQFKPMVDTGGQEEIQLNYNGYTADAVLVAVRAPTYQDQMTMGYNIKIGYIVPKFKETNGKVDYSGKRDGFYDASWGNDSQGIIKEGGFQGTAHNRTITGTQSGAQCDLMPAAGLTPSNYNGHYTGTLRNGLVGDASTNTTHLVLSSDAHRYIANNFGNLSTNIYTGIGAQCLVKIVSGAGVGQQCIANTILYTQDNCPVVELRKSADGTTTGITTPLDSTSVYTLGMKAVDYKNTSRSVLGITQIGCHNGRGISSGSNHTNAYGDKIGILHLPSEAKKKFTVGRKLVEIINRYSKEPWLINSYASAYYFSEGTETTQVKSDPNRITLLKEIRSRLNNFKLAEYPESTSDEAYVPATNNDTGADGKLAVVTHVTLDTTLDAAPGDYTGEDDYGIPYIVGTAEYGAVSERSTDELRDVLTGAWEFLRENRPEVYEKYFKVWENQIKGTNVNIPIGPENL